MKKIITCSILGVLALSMLVGCSGETTKPSSGGVSNTPAGLYRENEIRDYEGAKLDPSLGLRENSIKGVQKVNIDNYKLKLTGLVDKEMNLEYNDVLALDAHTRKITLHCVEGWDATILWKGALLEDIINLAGINPEANTVIFHSVDGYTTSLPLETIITKQLMLAYSANGLDLPPELGYPFIVVAENKFGYKWARWVSEIELSNNDTYKGYWERRGYDNEADL